MLGSLSTTKVYKGRPLRKSFEEPMSNILLARDIWFRPCRLWDLWYNALLEAGVVQLVERLLAKEKVMGSSPIARSV